MRPCRSAALQQRRASSCGALAPSESPESSESPDRGARVCGACGVSLQMRWWWWWGSGSRGGRKARQSPPPSLCIGCVESRSERGRGGGADFRGGTKSLPAPRLLQHALFPPSAATAEVGRAAVHSRPGRGRRRAHTRFAQTSRPGPESAGRPCRNAAPAPRRGSRRRRCLESLPIFNILALSSQSPIGPAGGASDGFWLGRGAAGPGRRCATTAAGALRVIV